MATPTQTLTPSQPAPSVQTAEQQPQSELERPVEARYLVAGRARRLRSLQSAAGNRAMARLMEQNTDGMASDVVLTSLVPPAEVSTEQPVDKAMPIPAVFLPATPAPAQVTPVALPPVPNLMEQELAEAATAPGTQVEQRRGEPAVIEREPPPLLPAAPALPGVTTKLPATGQPPASPARVAATGLDPAVAPLLAASAPAEAGENVELPAVPGIEEAVGAEAASEGGEEAAPEGGGETAPAEEMAAPEAPTAPAPSAKAAGALTPPAPQPDQLRAQIPIREPTADEFLAEVTAYPTAADAEIAIQTLLQNLRTDAEGAKAEVLNLAEQGKAEIFAEADLQVTMVESAMQTNLEAVRTYFADQRATLTTQLETMKAAIQSEGAVYLVQVRMALAMRNLDLITGVAQRQTDLQAFAQRENSQPPIVAEEEITRANRELDGAADEAIRVTELVASHYPGQDDPRPDQRAAAREVGVESAADIREKKGPLAERIRQRAAEFEGGYLEFAESASAQFAQVSMTLGPMLQAVADQAATAIQQSTDGTLQALDAQLTTSLDALTNAEHGAIDQISSVGHSTIEQVSLAAATAAGEVDAAAAATLIDIDNTVVEVEQGLTDSDFVPGARDTIDAARSTIADKVAAFGTQLGASVATARQGLANTVTVFSDNVAELVVQAQASAETIVQAGAENATQAVGMWREQTQQSLDNTIEQMATMVTQALADVDRGVRDARDRITGITEHFRGQLRELVTEALTEAKKPLTDPVPERAQEAAEEAGEAWYWGLLRALGDIVIGLLIVIAIAAVIAILTPLSFGAAVLLVGGVFLAAGLYTNYQRRSEQLSGEPGIGGGFIFLLALSDTVGITGVGEAIWGVDVVTGRDLSGSERWYRGTTGLVTAVMIVFGVRAAIKGPPGGWTRPTGLGGVRGFIEFFRTSSPMEWFRTYGDFILRNARELWGDFRTFARETSARILEGLRRLRQRLAAVTDPYARLALRYNLPEDVVDMMRNSGVEAEAYERLLNRGVDGETAALTGDLYGADGVATLDALLQSGVDSNAAVGLIAEANSLGRLGMLRVLAEEGVAGRLVRAGMSAEDMVLYLDEYGPNVIRMMDQMAQAGVTPRVAADAVDIAARNGILNDVQQLVNSGQLQNLQGLRNFLLEIEAELAAGQRGKLIQLRESLARAEGGSHVAVEGRAQTPGDPESGQADVVDYTAGEALQIKAVTGRGADAVVRNIQSAVNQLGGAGGELPPAGFRRIADVRLDLENPRYAGNVLENASRADALNELRSNINNLDNLNELRGPSGEVLRPEGEVRFTNRNGTHRFTPGELR